MWKENALKAAKWLAIIVLVAAVMFFVLRVLDVMMAWQLYSWFFQPLAESGIPETLSGAVAVWLMAAVILTLPAFLYALLTNRSKAVLIAATAVSAWFVIAYFISLPREGQLFNPITGRAMYRYSETDGKINLLPLGYRYDPATGEALKDMTPEVAKRYAAQEAPPTQVTVNRAPTETATSRQPERTGATVPSAGVGTATPTSPPPITISPREENPRLLAGYPVCPDEQLTTVRPLDPGEAIQVELRPDCWSGLISIPREVEENYHIFVESETSFEKHVYYGPNRDTQPLPDWVSTNYMLPSFRLRGTAGTVRITMRRER